MFIVMALLGAATGLVFADMVLAFRRRRAERRTVNRRLQELLAMDRVVHDRLYQMPLPEEADDYIDNLITDRYTPWPRVTPR